MQVVTLRGVGIDIRKTLLQSTQPMQVVTYTRVQRYKAEKLQSTQPMQVVTAKINKNKPQSLQIYIHFWYVRLCKQYLSCMTP